MDDDIQRRIDFFHMFLGLVAGIVSGSLGKNGGLIGLIIGYSGFFLTRTLFSLSREEYTLNTWVSKAAMSFFMSWIPVWIFVFNL